MIELMSQIGQTEMGNIRMTRAFRQDGEDVVYVNVNDKDAEAIRKMDRRRLFVRWEIRSQ